MSAVGVLALIVAALGGLVAYLLDSRREAEQQHRAAMRHLECRLEDEAGRAADAIFRYRDAVEAQAIRRDISRSA